MKLELTTKALHRYLWRYLEGLRRGTAEDFEIAVNTQVSDEDIRKVCQVLTTEPEGVKLK